jgi:hypothetical protein
MSQIRFFLVKFTLLLMIIAGIISTTIVLIPPDPEDFFQASVVKLNHLRNTPSPRIILVGGSNVAFGVDSELLESRFGLPVVNLGLHGGIGESTYKELSGYIRPGDIILLMPEYVIFSYKGILEGEDVALAQWMEYDLTRLRFVNPSRFPTLILTVAQIKATRRLASLFADGDLGRGVYIIENFNSHGDFIGQVNAEEPIKKLQNDPYFKSGDFYLETYRFFEQFNLDAKAKGAVVYFEFPASRVANCRATGMERLEEFYSTLLERTTIPVLTALDEICYPNSYFFDTNYHLNGVGRRVMTERIIKDLLPLLR